MRETRNCQSSIFDFYAPHALGNEWAALSELLDSQEWILPLLEQDLRDGDTARTGAHGLSTESVFRCMLLKHRLQVSYEQLAFHLADSPTYRCFARLRTDQFPKRSGLQSTIRQIRSETWKKINEEMLSKWSSEGVITLAKLRIDSTVVLSNILDPLDSQLLDDGNRVLSRLLCKCKVRTGLRIRFTDQRKKSKSIAYKIFLAKKPIKELFYPKLLSVSTLVIKQATAAIAQVRARTSLNKDTQKWIVEVEHYLQLLKRVIDQTQRRVFNDEAVPPQEKLVSLFEPHTDIIVKGARDTYYGHKINLATQADGFITYLNIEQGNPSDTALYLPVLNHCRKHYDQLPVSVVADGGYASSENLEQARAEGIKHTVFNKPIGNGYHAMGVKKKTFIKLSNFRAGVEGNISEFKRAFGATQVTWKGEDGFNAFVFCSQLAYNLMHRVRLDTG